MSAPRTVHRTGARPTLEEAQTLVGGPVELITLSDGRQMLVNEEGRWNELPYNDEASLLYGFSPIVGNVLVLGGDARWVD